MINNILEVENLCVDINKCIILQNVSFSLRKGDFFVLFGKDDSGKTTLLSALMGFICTYSGKIRVYGGNANICSEKDGQKLRFVADDIIMEDLTGEEYFSIMKKNVSEYDLMLEQKLCTQYGIPLGERLLNMTYQENKLTGLISAIASKPGLLILDEPFNFLTKKASESFLEILCELNKGGMSIILAVEKYADVRNCCNSYAYLVEGRIKKFSYVPTPDYRWKVVSLAEGDGERISKSMDKFIATHHGRSFYLYKGDGHELIRLLDEIGCKDCLIEDVPLECEIDEDFTHWE